MIRTQATLKMLFLAVLIVFCNSPDEDGKIERRNNAISFAGMYSHTKSARGWQDVYWDCVAGFPSIEDYEEVLNLNRDTSSTRYLSPDDQWYWDNDSLREMFGIMRDDSK